jgi:hypothetical protein
MKEPFKVGDRVRLVSYDNALPEHMGRAHGIPLGAEGTVRELIDRDGDIAVQFKYDWFYVKPSSLEPVSTLRLEPEAIELAKLVQIFCSLGPRARTLFTEIGQRLVKGAREHGDFDPTEKRDWTQEALEEDLDACIYRTLDTLERAGRLPA